MSPLTTKPIYFGSFLVTSQVFHLTPLTFCLVNLKPLLPGHVLVSPLRAAPRLRDLTPAEAADLFVTVRRVGRTLERVYGASALNVAVQDGADAGQSVPHVHAHIIPRRADDLGAPREGGGPDKVYDLLEGEDGDVGRLLRERDEGTGGRKGKFPAVDADEEREPRSEEEMRREAEWLAEEMKKDEEVEGEEKEAKGG
ncbi:HIT-like domain-containing protein [Lineolata rhizophorae]|uniref:Bis(5'-adenosyl)-triphosphatase n=1 Tax=Lineolata rhizophorae TaxID=578093 RepID=A0A6A6NUK2_9PEZI|nr:HIT-like domain-containing protein [Lineolata rhizophorae]